MTKRCPEATCRHLLIQPDTKSTRFKIKMVASNYIPEVEVGRRRRRLQSGDLDQPMTSEEAERRRRERRKTRTKGGDEDEAMETPLRPGEVVRDSTSFMIDIANSSTRSSSRSRIPSTTLYRFA